MAGSCWRAVEIRRLWMRRDLWLRNYVVMLIIEVLINYGVYIMFEEGHNGWFES